MEYNSDRKVKLLITTVLLATTGILVDYVYFRIAVGVYEMFLPFAWILTLMFTGVFAAAWIYTKRKWLVWIVSMGVLASIAFIAWEPLAGGLIYVTNDIIERIVTLLNLEGSYIYMPSRFSSVYSVELAGVVILGVLSFFYTLCFLKRKLILLIFILNNAVMIVLGIGFSKGTVSGELIWLIALDALLSVLMISSYNHHKNPANTLLLHEISLGVGTGMLIILSLFFRFSGYEYYSKPSYFQNAFETSLKVVEEIQNGKFQIAGINPFGGHFMGGGWDIGGGKLGQLDKLEFADKTVMKVTMPQKAGKTYVKGFIGQTYDQNQWLVPDVEDYNALFENLRGQGYFAQEMVASLTSKLGNVKSNEFYMTIDFLSEKSSYQYAPLYPVIDFSVGHKDDSGFTKISSTQKILATQYELPYITDLSLQEITSSNPDAQLELKYRDYVYDTYLDVNTSMKEELIRQFGGFKTDTQQERLDLAEYIRQYLAANYSYTTAPGKLPEGKDFVAYFLTESKKGYCTYFSTAAVMMLRSAGIPARYVEGYSFRPSSSSENAGSDLYITNGTSSTTDYSVVEVLDRNAHAWVELYLDGIGWVDFEVTPGNFVKKTPEKPTEPTETTTQNETTTKAPVETTTQPQPTTQKHASETTSNHVLDEKVSSIDATLVRRIIFGGMVFVVLSGFAIFFWVHKKKVAIEYQKLYNIEDDSLRGVCIVLNYNRMEKMLKAVGYRRPEHMGFREFKKILQNDCPYIGGDEAETLFALYEKAVFSKEAISKEEVKRSEEIVSKVRHRIYENMGAFRKMIFGWIRNN